MKSIQVKRREARERIERSLPALDAEIALVQSTLAGAGDDALKSLATRHADLLRKRLYRLEEIERIKAREANPKRAKKSISKLAHILGDAIVEA
jgi:hypothetical protein